MKSNTRNIIKLRGDVLLNDRLTIAMFTNNYSPFVGGVPISINRLAKGLRQKGHTVYIFAPKYPAEDPADDEFIIRCSLLTYYKTKMFDFAIVNIFSPKIEREFLKHRFDLIHVHHPFWMGKKGLNLGNKHNIPVVFTYHTRLDMYYHYLPAMKLLFKHFFSHKIVREFSKACDAVFAPSNTSKDYLSGLGVSRLTDTLPTGIDPDNFRGVTEEAVNKIKELYSANKEVILCTVSRLAKEKNIYFLIESVKYIKENTTVPFKCIIVGDGPEKEDILRLILKEGLQDTILLVGLVPSHDVGKYYMASDIFVFASKSETQGMVLLEAMMGKCPVVAVSSSGIDDVIVDGHNGYKTPEDIQLWADRVVYLLENEDKLMEMSENAYRYAEKFLLEAMAAKAAKIYAKAIKNNKDL